MGRVFQATYTQLDPKTGTRVPGCTKSWYIEYTDSTGRRIRRKAGLTKEQAKNALVQAESEVLNLRNGLPSACPAEIPCSTLRERYLKSLQTRVTPEHHKRVALYTDEVLTNCHIHTMRDMRSEDVEVYLDSLSREKGLGNKAINERLFAMKAMLNWGVTTRILPYSPLASIGKRDEKADRRHVRRPLTDAEIESLLAAALHGPERRTLRRIQNRHRKDGTLKPITLSDEVLRRLLDEGRHQILRYRLMLDAGLRKSEVGSLTWGDLDLEGETLTTRPWWTGNKNGKEESLPLSPTLLAKLRAYKLAHPSGPSERVTPITSRFLWKFNEDLVAAGIARRVPVDKLGKPIEFGSDGHPVAKPWRWRVRKTDVSGRVVDLHALRHTFATRLGRTPGIDPKTVQTLLRHSTPMLSFGIYVHADRERIRDAVKRLSPLPASPT